jgi:acetyltransferase-like isoleucine patch superfamily enzyme
MVQQSSFLSDKELAGLGFKSLGNHIKVSRHVVFYGIENIAIGDYSRIDDFCLLSASQSGEILIGKNVHISAGVFLYGGGGIQIDDFAGISAGSKVFSVTDDFSGAFLTNPTIPSEYTNVTSKRVELHKHSLVGAGTILFPGAVLPEGTAVGAMSLVDRELAPWGIYVGIPARRLKDRSRKILELEESFLKRIST